VIHAASAAAPAGQIGDEWIPSVLHPITGRPASPHPLPGIALAASDAAAVRRTRKTYLGGGDASHLGGYTQLDTMGLSPAVWRYMMQNLTVKSLIDLGCGKGVSTSWFAAHGADVMCIEGSSDAVKSSRVPRQTVEHDVSRGPWWPNRTYDAVWSVEFVEHVGRQFLSNYLPVLDSAALVFISYSSWGGWHHVEVHNGDWWRNRFTAAGLVYSDSLTQKVRTIASSARTEAAANGVQYNAQHIWTHMHVYINPPVMRLKAHAHLIGNPGCYWRGSKMGEDGTNRDCGTQHGDGETSADVLPRRFRPLRGAFKSDAEVGWTPPDPV